MADEQKKITINVDPNLYAISNVNIGFGEESFLFRIISGNQGRQFQTTPKHAKRIYLLLGRILAEYEKKYNTKIETELPEKKETSKEKPMGIYPE